MVAILSSGVINGPDAGSECKKGQKMTNGEKLPPEHVYGQKTLGIFPALEWLEPFPFCTF